MTSPKLAATDFGGPPNASLLILGPSLGTSAATLWTQAARLLTARVHVVAWDLPGHGHSAPTGAFGIPELAAAVLALVDEIAPNDSFHYAGNSIGGAVGLQLLLDAPGRVSTATLVGTGAAIGSPDDWRNRAATVQASGTADLVAQCLQRWFAPAFADRHSDVTEPLLDALRATDDECYAHACTALAQFDVTARLAEITVPVMAVAGAEDVATPPDSLRRIASEVKDGRLVVLDDVGHLAPAEAPDRLAALISTQLGLAQSDYEAGMAVRRAVLGDAHVDRAIANSTHVTADFQDMITRYAWGNIWTRPGLDRRSRSLITLTALVARGHHEELAMHLRAARRNGLRNDEIKELLLQTAIYCGVPDANTAFRIADAVLTDFDTQREL
jgi:3-oxoadipate enol-lactonase/4-carboxymuconolactone decarboxylase